MSRFKTILLFGAPGSGKGTQGRTLGTIPQFYHCACGDVFRGLDVQSKLGREFLKYSSKGKLVPDEITVKLWVKWIEAMIEAKQFRPNRDFLVLDGIPRNVAQAELMEEYIEVEHIFHLSCPDRDKLITRLKNRALKDNRLDDANEEIIRNRLTTYEAESKPMLQYYSKSLRTDIDASRLPMEVLYRILGEVLHKLKN